MLVIYKFVIFSNYIIIMKCCKESASLRNVLATDQCPVDRLAERPAHVFICYVIR